MKRYLIILALIIASLSVMGMVTAPDINLNFSHKLHVEDVGVECSTCHAAETSTSPTDNLLPPSETCYTCHDKSTTKCSICHKDTSNSEVYPHKSTYIAKFSHNRHISHGIACSKCHASLIKSEDSSVQHLPGMAVCQSCHKNLDKSDYCYVCHGKGEQLKPASHRLDWRQAHGAASQLNGDDCKKCHLEKNCMECHQQDNLDRKVHPLNYIYSHGLAAKAKRDNCYTCHEEQESCQNCHREQLVLPQNHNTAGWANKTNGGRHARAAKMDFDNCLACHNDHYGEPVCAECHQAKQ
jgi:hypothetical protein